MTRTKRPLWKRILRLFMWVLIIPVLLIVALIGIVFVKQEALVQRGLDMANENFKGRLTIKNSKISPFHDFPNISIDLKDVRIYETKTDTSNPVVVINHLFIDFDAKKALQGKYKVNNIEANGGKIRVVEDSTGNYNITKAFEALDTTTASVDTSVFKLSLKKIKLKNITISHRNEVSGLKISGKFKEMNASFRMGTRGMKTSVEGKFAMTVINGKDTTFVRNKNFDVNISVRYSKKYNMLVVNKSVIKLEDVPFGAEGRVFMKDKVYMDMKFNGERSDFNLLFAFLPPDLAQYMNRYKSTGLLYFDAAVKGIVAEGIQPQISADFGCKNGYFKNSNYNRKLENLAFTGYFTNGAKRDITTFEVGLLDMYALPEEGDVQGSIVVRNFADPTVNMDVTTDFDLQYLAQFLQLEELNDLSGQVSLKVHYDELVDIAMPKTSFAKLKQGVDSELKIRNLTFKAPGYPHLIKDLNLSAEMKNKQVNLEYCTASVGGSDISVKGFISNLPEILHKTDVPVRMAVNISSKNLDVKELTTFDSLKMKPVDEQITGLFLNMSMRTSAKKLTDTMYKIPAGTFTIHNLNAKLKHYKHAFKDFKAQVHIDTSMITLDSLVGMIDKSDVNLSGTFRNYRMWFNKETKGTSLVTYKVLSKGIRLRNLLNYGGNNYMPEDLKREKIKELYLEGDAKITYDQGFKAAEMNITKAEGKLRIHPLKLTDVSGTIKYSDQRLRVRKLKGKLGENDFSISMAYFFGNPAEAPKINRFTLRSKHFNLNEIITLNERKKRKRDSLIVVQPEQHDSVFNVFSLPFSNMKIKLEIGEFIYNKIVIKDIKARMRLQSNHVLCIDTFDLDMADGHIDFKGCFDGSNKEKIFFKPDIAFTGVDLTKLFLKFDNFGQEYIVADNISGKFTGKLTGKIRMHADLVPIIERSRIKLESTIINGSLNNYGPMSLLADYFKDKNLKMIRFDTLINTFTLKKGVINIPNMQINSSLGFIEFSGTQALTSDMDYHVKVPMKMVTDVGFKYLFGKKKEEVDSTQVDEIIVRDEKKKLKFLNLHITGNSEDFKISLKKK